jgi:hypothetical protein
VEICEDVVDGNVHHARNESQDVANEDYRHSVVGGHSCPPTVAPAVSWSAAVLVRRPLLDTCDFVRHPVVDNVYPCRATKLLNADYEYENDMGRTKQPDTNVVDGNVHHARNQNSALWPTAWGLLKNLIFFK